MVFKTFFLHAKDIFASMSPSLRGVKLEVRGGFSYDRRDREQVLCIGPHCQCAGKAEVARSREAWVVKMVRWKKGHKKKVRVPCYAISEAASKMKASGQCTKTWSLIGLSFAGVDVCGLLLLKVACPLLLALFFCRLQWRHAPLVCKEFVGIINRMCWEAKVGNDKANRCEASLPIGQMGLRWPNGNVPACVAIRCSR